MRSNSKQALRVTLSGFTQDKNHQNYVETLKKIYGQYSGVLHKNTDILCITSVNSQKYKIAQILVDSRIKVLKKQWMQECYSKNKRIDVRNYEVRSLFYGFKLGLHGFNKEEQQKIIDKIDEEEGIAQSIKLQKISSQDDYHCIMVSSRCVELPQNVHQLSIPIVTIEWYNRCLQKQAFVFPIDYALNYEILNIRLQMPKLAKCANKARQILKKAKFDDQQYDFLEGKVFYLHNFDDRPKKQTKQIIATYGGFYLDQLSSLHTHIICSDYNEEEYKMFLKYGNYVKIIKLSWLIDCVFTQSALPEDDYILRKHNFKIKQKSYRSVVNLSDNNNSFSFGQFTNIHQTLRRGISISHGNFQSLQRSNNEITIKTKIFKDMKFFIIRQQYQKQHLKQLIKKIKQNSGIIPKWVKGDDQFFLVMADSKDNMNHISKAIQKKLVFTKVSHRWIDACVKSGDYINPEEKYRFTFSPFTMSTPVSFILQLTIDIIGYDDLQRRRIHQLIEVVGKTTLVKRKQTVTHVICQPSRFRQQLKYRQYKELMASNPHLKIKFIKLSWILDSLNQSSQQPIDKYIIQ